MKFKNSDLLQSYTCKSSQTIFLPSECTHFGGLQHHLDNFNTFMFTNSEISCRHVHHLQTFYHASAHFWIFNAIHTCHTKYLLNCKHWDINSFDSSAFLMHWYVSLNISIVQGHASVLSLVFSFPSVWHLWHSLPGIWWNMKGCASADVQRLWQCIVAHVWIVLNIWRCAAVWCADMR